MKRALKSLGAAVQKREVVIINRRLCMKLIEREISRNSRIGRRETNAVD